jgi:hypothetical protein
VTNWQKVSNFFLDIRLERPEAVVVDRTSRELRDIYNQTDCGNAASFHIIVEGMDLPEYQDKGVLVYDEDEEEFSFYQDFYEKEIDEEDREALEELVPECLETNEISLKVDAYNEFDLTIPSNNYINNVDFDQLEEILEDQYRLGRYNSE